MCPWFDRGFVVQAYFRLDFSDDGGTTVSHECGHDVLFDESLLDSLRARRGPGQRGLEVARASAYTPTMDALGRVRKAESGEIVGAPGVMLFRGTGLICVRDGIARLKTVTAVEARLRRVCTELPVVLRMPLAETAAVFMPSFMGEYWLEVAFLLDQAVSQSGRDPELETLVDHPHPAIQRAARVLDQELP